MDKKVKIKPGDDIFIEYRVFLTDGSLSDTNIGEAPAVFRYGANEILSSIETVLLGKALGEEIKLTLSPDQAYGTIDEDAFETVPLATIPLNMRIVDAIVRFNATQNEARIHAIDENSITLDYNHPLAGETLTYIIRIVDIKSPHMQQG